MTPRMPIRVPPHNGAQAIVPNDAGAIRKTSALYIGGAGNLRVLMAGGQDVTFVGVPGAAFLSIAVIRVFATNTTATNIVGLYTT